MKFLEVVNALPEPDAPLGHIDFFALTWQCSHIRFCRALWDGDDYSRENTLAWVLKLNADDYRPDWIDSLANASAKPVAIAEIVNSLVSANDEIKKSDHLANPSRLPLMEQDLEDAVEPRRIDRLSFYNFGPTAVFIWERPAEFNYLEFHFES